MFQAIDMPVWFGYSKPFDPLRARKEEKGSGNYDLDVPLQIRFPRTLLPAEKMKKIDSLPLTYNGTSSA